MDDGTAHRSPALRALTAAITIALTVVIVAPIALSSQDLVRWAADPDGLGLRMAWAWLAFVALDAAAAVCVGMVTVAAWRGETGGAFHALTWMFAFGSAAANYRHGLATPAADDEFFFPAMSLAGPLLLDVTLARIRRWARIEAHTQMSARPRFGARWLPGVAFTETFAAWRTAVREGIDRPDHAIAQVRETRALHGLSQVDALHLARQALATSDPYLCRQWLLARGVVITQDAIEQIMPAPKPLAIEAPTAPAIEAPTDTDTTAADGDTPATVQTRRRPPTRRAATRPTRKPRTTPRRPTTSRRLTVITGTTTADDGQVAAALPAARHLYDAHVQAHDGKAPKRDPFITEVRAAGIQLSGASAKQLWRELRATAADDTAKEA